MCGLFHMPTPTRYESLSASAIALLQQTCSPQGVVASAAGGENYDRIWARDTAVVALACIRAGLADFYPILRHSLDKLGEAAAPTGQIPSNISIDGTRVSFGGPVGRTDASFWWIIAQLALDQVLDDDKAIRVIRFQQVDAILRHSEAWEFNYQHLMYVPLSSNWADEYITEGYVLFDQLLRYEAFRVAGLHFDRADWMLKSDAIGDAIRSHFNQFPDRLGGLYTETQRNWWMLHGQSHTAIASFTPGKIVQRWDAWSFAWLLKLNLVGTSFAAYWLKQIDEWVHNEGKLVPAFYPAIEESDADYGLLASNYAFRFKNHPGHFHNGGCWPVIQGFLIDALHHYGAHATADGLRNLFAERLHQHQSASLFPEYFQGESQQPGGKQQLSFSAAGWLLAAATI